jgi:hypothetical protein
MMFSDSEDIESHLVGVLDLLNQVTEALRCAQRPAGVIVRRRETINADLNGNVHGSSCQGATGGGGFAGVPHFFESCSHCVSFEPAKSRRQSTVALDLIEVNYLDVNIISFWYS